MNQDRQIPTFVDLTEIEEAALHAWWRRLSRREIEALAFREPAKRVERVTA